MKGILFKPDMIKAIVEGRKTVTRRIIPQCHKKYPNGFEEFADFIYPAREKGYIAWYGKAFSEGLADFTKRQYKTGFMSKYIFGETVYIKEAWRVIDIDTRTLGQPVLHVKAEFKLDYFIDWVKIPATTHFTIPDKWHSPLHLAQKAARYFLKIKDVRPERLQEINSDRHDEVLKEGYPFIYDIKTLNENPVNTYARYWNSINGKGSWESNPFVWRYEFEKTMGKMVS